MQSAWRWASWVGHWPMPVIAMAWVVLGSAAPARAQFSRYADEIEIKALDLHPRPSLLREIGTRIYGAIDLGLVTEAVAGPPGRCNTALPSQVAGITPSLLGLEAGEMLQDGWRALMRLEHGLNAATGLPSNDCGLFFDRAALVGLAHRRWGRLELGRQQHPAYGVALRGDPWSGNGPASPNDISYYGRPVYADGKTAPAGSFFRVRAPQSVTYTSLESNAVWGQVQVSLTRSALGVPDPQTADDEREYGVALHWQTADWHAAVGAQRWNRESWALPLSLTWMVQRWTVHAGITRGQRADGPYSNVLLGFSLADGGGAHPGLKRFGLNLHRDAQDRTTGHLGAGAVWPLSRRTQIEADAGLGWPREPGRCPLRAGVALQHRFSL